jgi:hypothetical protein
LAVSTSNVRCAERREEFQNCVRWLVKYEIGGEQLADYWFYVHHRWVFDLVLSNPDMVPLYRMSSAQYVAAVGCAH